MSNITFQDRVTLITAEWLNFVNAVANAGTTVGITSDAVDGPPTSGFHEAGEFLRNRNITVLGEGGTQYVIDGWKCIGSGTPGAWVPIMLQVAPSPSVAAPTAGPSPAPSPASGGGGGGTLYSATVQGEDMTGATLIDAAGIAAQGIPSGFIGTGMADEDSTAGVTKTATFTTPDCTADITFRFFGFGNQQNSYQIDGNAPVSVMWNGGGAYQNLTISGVALSAGTHTVKFISEWGFTYIDAVTVTQTSAVTPVSAHTPPPAPAATPGVNYPFGSRLDGPYAHAITVTADTPTNQDIALKRAYGAWKSLRVKTAPPYPGGAGSAFAGQTITDGVYVDSPQTIVAPDNTTGYPGLYSLTVSEAMGYGMLLCVIFAGYDGAAQTTFDSMLKFVRSRPAYSEDSASGANVYLMDYRIGTRTGKTGDPIDVSFQGGGWNAADGDMDIIYALLMAHRQWGSAGTWNYWQEAQNGLRALKAVDFASNGVMYVPPLGNPPHNCSRTSDYMFGHFTVFKAATGDTFWDDAITNSKALVSQVISTFSPVAHLPPDWIYKPFSDPQPSPGGVIEAPAPFEGSFGANAVRCPWRWAAYYIYSADAATKTLVSNIVTTIKTSAGGSASSTSWLYALTGDPFTAGYYEPTTDAMTMAGALVDVSHQAWLDACYTKLTTDFNTNYFAAELSLLALVLVTGNWWKPL